MTKEEKDIIFNRLFELEEQHPAFAENVRDNAYCEAIADVKRIIERINETSLPSNLDEAAEEIVKDWNAYGDGEYKKLVIAGAEWMAGQGVSVDGEVVISHGNKTIEHRGRYGIQETTTPGIDVFNVGDKVVVQIRKR